MVPHRGTVGRAGPAVRLVALVCVLAAGCSEGQRATPGPAGSTPSCATPGAPPSSGCWRQILPLGSGGFPPSPGSRDRPLWEPGRFPLTLTPLVSFGDNLWMTARQVAYSSADGLAWQEHAKTDWGGRIYHSIVHFKGKLWMHGGMDYESRAMLNDVWSSSDGVTWAKVGTAAWPGRGGHAMVVHRDTLWLLGGADRAAEDRSTEGFLNDVWASDDGLEWRRVTGAAPWSPRDDAGAVVLGDELFVVGGGGKADVWRSSDGRDWVELTPDAAWKPRHGSARTVFDGKLWVFGGWIGAPTNALNDVWYSGDGVTWTRQVEHAPWSPRSPVTVVFDDRIWIYSGKHTGADDNWGGDLWQMTAASAASS